MEHYVIYIIAGLFSLAFLAYSLATLFVKNHQPSGLLKDKNYPKVSILKPLKNLDDGIEENLESFLNIEYPEFEIFFAVDKINDPIVKIIKKIQKKYPEIDSKIIATGHCNQYNPKVHKLSIMEKKSTGDLLWINDSNVRVESGVLLGLVNEYLLNDTKLIFSPIHATGDKTIGSIIENSYINLFLSGNVILAWKLFKQHIIVGKSILFERKTLEHLGGFSYFRDYLAEDFMMGEIYKACRFPIATNYVWVTNINSSTTIRGFFSRMSRWAKLRFRLKPYFYLFEILLNPIAITIITLSVLGLKNGLPITGGIIMIKLFLELLNQRYVNGRTPEKPLVILSFPFLFLFKDILLFFAYFTPFFSDTVNWRGGGITIGKKTLIADAQDTHQLEGA